MATTIDTPAALAWLIASSVCGITPSSAATTITAMSVTLAPRAPIFVEAFCEFGRQRYVEIISGHAQLLELEEESDRRYAEGLGKRPGTDGQTDGHLAFARLRRPPLPFLQVLHPLLGCAAWTEFLIDGE